MNCRAFPKAADLDASYESSALVSVAPGRDLHFSPDWNCSDACVVFDANSGDYWVVSPLALMVLRELQGHGPQSKPDLEHGLAPNQSYFDLSAVLALSLQSLADNGLVEPGQALELPGAHLVHAAD